VTSSGKAGFLRFRGNRTRQPAELDRIPLIPASQVLHLSTSAGPEPVVRLASLTSVQRDSLQTSHKSEKRVLVVDDNEVIANTLSMVLRSAGYYAVAAYSGKQALELLRSDSIDLLLSDVMMPQMTGIELAIEATRKRHVQSVLLMSGVSATADLLTNARKLGYHFEILAKPMHPDEVIDRIRNLLSGEGAAGVDSSLSS